MIRHAIVFDCMVFVQIIASKGSAHRCYEKVSQEQTPLLASVDTLAELRAVLGRSDLQRKLPGITPERVTAVMHHLGDLVTLIQPVPKHFAFPPDPKDEPYLNLAVEGNASALVTRDKALLRLSEPHDKLAIELRLIMPSLQVLVPEDFLAGRKAAPSFNENL